MKELGATLLLTFFVLALILTSLFGQNGLKAENENLVKNNVSILKKAQESTTSVDAGVN